MKMETKFEQRLREILTEYPDIDPERAVLALKGQPEATNEQIAQLSKFRPGETERGAPPPSKQTGPPAELLRALEKRFAQKSPHLRPNGPHPLPEWAEKELAQKERAYLKNQEQQEKTIVLFRKDAYRIIALFPEIPGNIHDASLCLSFVYTDTNAFFRETGIKYPRDPLDQREADIADTINKTTRAEPLEYEQLKNILESDYGFVLEVIDEVNDEMHLRRHNTFMMDLKEEKPDKEPDEIIINNMHIVQKDTPKRDFWRTVFTGFVFVVLGLIYLLFLVVVSPAGGFNILLGILFGFIALCYFVGKWFLSQK